MNEFNRPISWRAADTRSMIGISERVASSLNNPDRTIDPELIKGCEDLNLRVLSVDDPLVTARYKDWANEINHYNTSLNPIHLIPRLIRGGGRYPATEGLNLGLCALDLLDDACQELPDPIKVRTLGGVGIAAINNRVFVKDLTHALQRHDGRIFSPIEDGGLSMDLLAMSNEAIINSAQELSYGAYGASNQGLTTIPRPAEPRPYKF